MSDASSGRRMHRLVVLLGAACSLAAAGAPMQPVVEALTLEDTIAAAAYAGSLPP
jgi:hypothetical protein